MAGGQQHRTPPTSTMSSTSTPKRFPEDANVAQKRCWISASILAPVLTLLGVPKGNNRMSKSIQPHSKIALGAPGPPQGRAREPGPGPRPGPATYSKAIAHRAPPAADLIALNMICIRAIIAIIARMPERSLELKWLRMYRKMLPFELSTAISMGWRRGNPCGSK